MGWPTPYRHRATVKLVTASRGKVLRAEPVVALYEQYRIHHVGQFPALEDELCTWEPPGNAPSPGRLDAMTWAATELMIDVATCRVQRLPY
jgi:phage terminase large subunit-like protein